MRGRFSNRRVQKEGGSLLFSAFSMPNPAATANSKANPHPQPGETAHTVMYFCEKHLVKTDRAAKQTGDKRRHKCAITMCVGHEMEVFEQKSLKEGAVFVLLNAFSMPNPAATEKSRANPVSFILSLSPPSCPGG